MKLTLSRTLAAAALLGLATVGSVAHARTAWSVGVNIPVGGYGYYGGPAYVAPPVAYAPPAPVYYAPPAPVYYAPQPVYYAPAPVYYAPRVVYRPRVWVRPAPFVGIGFRAW
jgi:hypothetical protein